MSGKRRLFFVLVFCAVLLIGAALGRVVWEREPQQVPLSQFGGVRVYAPFLFGLDDRGVVVLLSSSQGWGDEARAAALDLQARGYLVLGMDVGAYYADRQKSKDTCLYPSGLIEEALALVQKQRGDAYQRAVLVGLGDAGGLAASIVQQAMSGTYKGFVAPSFCSRLLAPVPLCLGERLAVGEGVASVRSGQSVDAVVGEIALDPFCSVRGAGWDAVARVSSEGALGDEARFVREALARIEGASVTGWITALADEPVVPMVGRADNPWLVVFYSGDGGWRDIDRQIAGVLHEKGFSVLGVDSLRAFWRKQTPLEEARRLDRLIVEGKKAWGKSRVALMGYSFGADIFPFVVPLLNEVSSVQQVTFLMLGREASFEISVGAYLGKGDVNYPIAEALKKWPSIPSLCFYGRDEEKNTSCLESVPSLRPIVREGGHHFDRDYRAIAELIARELVSH